MANFVLVHGAWSGSWVYGGIARRLRAAGHAVFAPSLTGLGDRAHLLSPAIDLETHVRDVANIIRHEDLRDVILCGHSYGGMVITGVASLCADRIRTLFYLDAFLPADGQALWDIADEAGRAHYVAAQKATPGLVAPFAPATGDARGRNGGPGQLSAHPLLTLLQPVSLGGAEAGIPNRTYVYATRSAPTTFTRFYEAVRNDPAWRVHTIDTGHVVMADDPEGLTRLLLDEVGR